MGPPLVPLAQRAVGPRLLFHESIRRVLTQVHATCSLNQQSTDFLDSQLVQVLSRLAASNFTTLAEVRERVSSMLPDELADHACKAGDDAVAQLRKMMESKRPASTVDTLVFPLELMSNDAFIQSEKVDLEAQIYLIAVVEYLCADILKLAGNLAENQQRRTIDLNDIKSTLFLDPVLQEFFLRLRSEQLIMWLKEREDALGRDIVLLQKVFAECLKPLKDQNPLAGLFAALGEVAEFHRNALKLLADATDLKGVQALVDAVVASQSHFVAYARAFDSHAAVLAELSRPAAAAGSASAGSLGSGALTSSASSSSLASASVSPALSALRKALEERQLAGAADFHLARLLFAPIGHIVGYHVALLRLSELVPEDREVAAVAAQVAATVDRMRETSVRHGFEPLSADEDPRTNTWRRVEFAELQAKIEGWTGKSIIDWNPILLKTGSLQCHILVGGARKHKKPKERTLFLFNKFIISVKPTESLLSKRTTYVLKDVIPVNALSIREVNDAEDIKWGLEIPRKDGTVLVTFRSDAERAEWLSALTYAVTAHQLGNTLERVLAQQAMMGPELPPELRLAPSEYRFAEPDTPDNIIFETANSGDLPLIKGATILKLVERLTYDKYADTNYVIQFLLTYRSFMEPAQLLDMLIERFNIPNPSSASPEQLEYFKNAVRKPVQLRVFNVVKHWIDKHYNDFGQNTELMTKLVRFVDEMGKVEGIDKAVPALVRTIKKRREEEKTGENLSDRIFSGTFPEPIRAGVTDLITDAQQLDPLELARQMTLVEFELYRSIKPSECLNQRWTKKNKDADSPNVLAMIAHFNRVSNWVKTCVTFKEDLVQRVELVHFFIRVAERCMELNNFNGAMEIISGLNSIPVNRLKITWSLLPPRASHAFSEMIDLLNPEKSYARFRRVLHTRQPPCLPYFGVYLTDLTFIEDGNKDMIPGTELVNFAKCRRTAGVLTEIQQYQQLPYALQRVDEIARFLTAELTEEDDEVCYQKSLEIEPRGATKEELLASSTVANSGAMLSRSKSLMDVDAASSGALGSSGELAAGAFPAVGERGHSYSFSASSSTSSERGSPVPLGGSPSSGSSFPRKMSLSTTKLVDSISSSSRSMASSFLKSVARIGDRRKDSKDRHSPAPSVVGSGSTGNLPSNGSSGALNGTSPSPSSSSSTSSTPAQRDDDDIVMRPPRPKSRSVPDIPELREGNGGASVPATTCSSPTAVDQFTGGKDRSASEPTRLLVNTIAASSTGPVPSLETPTSPNEVRKRPTPPVPYREHRASSLLQASAVPPQQPQQP